MSTWKLESAKARLSEVVRQARERGPQVITVRGDSAAVVVSADDYKRLVAHPDATPWVDRLRAAFTGDIDLERDADRGRDLPL
jgi:antitoxin Phd